MRADHREDPRVYGSTDTDGSPFPVTAHGSSLRSSSEKLFFSGDLFYFNEPCIIWSFVDQLRMIQKFFIDFADRSGYRAENIGYSFDRFKILKIMKESQGLDFFS